MRINRRGHIPHNRQRVSTIYHHQGLQTCRKTYCFLHGIGKTRLSAVRSSLVKNGITPRIHGNAHHQPHHAFSPEDVRGIVTYLSCYAEANAILLPGRIPGYKNSDIQLLPSNTTKRAVWEKYSIANEGTNLRLAKYTTFCEVWRKYLPKLIVMKPMTDLCWLCQKNSNAIIRSANKSEEEKSMALRLAEEHIKTVRAERALYRMVCQKSMDTVKSTFVDDEGIVSPPGINSSLPPCSNNITIHYSFDFAQQVHYPTNPQQPSPVYFLTPRKCAIFGVCCEAIPRQVNFLVDEAVDTGKGANTVVSMLHYFFAHHGLSESNLHLHADNCVGQNKNNTVIQVSQIKT